MKLVKINEEHYVVVDNLEIKEGDWYIDDTLQILQALPPRKDWINSGKNGYIICKKITHSTEPVDNVNGFPAFIVGGVQELSLQEVKGLIGEVDVEKKVRNEMGIPDYLPINSMSPSMQGSLEFGINCYNQALEDNKEKKYTQQELIWAIQEAYGHGQDDEFDGIFHLAESIEVITKSLQPKTEWEVELETIDNRQPCHCQCHNNIQMVHFVACCNDGWIGTVTQKLKLK